MNFSKITLAFIYLSLLILSTKAEEEEAHQLSIVSPPSLKSLFNSGKLPFSLANFG